MKQKKKDLTFNDFVNALGVFMEGNLSAGEEIIARFTGDFRDKTGAAAKQTDAKRYIMDTLERKELVTDFGDLPIELEGEYGSRNALQIVKPYFKQRFNFYIVEIGGGSHQGMHFTQVNPTYKTPEAMQALKKLWKQQEEDTIRSQGKLAEREPRQSRNGAVQETLSRREGEYRVNDMIEFKHGKVWKKAIIMGIENDTYHLKKTNQNFQGNWGLFKIQLSPTQIKRSSRRRCLGRPDLSTPEALLELCIENGYVPK